MHKMYLGSKAVLEKIFCNFPSFSFKTFPGTTNPLSSDRIKTDKSDRATFPKMYLRSLSPSVGFFFFHYASQWMLRRLVHKLSPGHWAEFINATFVRMGSWMEEQISQGYNEKTVFFHTFTLLWGVRVKCGKHNYLTSDYSEAVAPPDFCWQLSFTYITCIADGFIDFIAVSQVMEN
jgi:hypothetical protein